MFNRKPLALRMGTSASRHAAYREAIENPAAILSAEEVNPYDVLGVPQNFTFEELKNAYRRTARLVHPDKGGSEKLFKLATDCFRKLSEDYQYRMGGRQFAELKAESQAAAAGPAGPRAPPPIDDSDGNFAARFNRAFEENRFDDEEVSRGYGDRMEASSAKRGDIPIERKLSKFKPKEFNRIFEETTLAEGAADMVVYKEPEPMILAKTIQFTELGADAPGDFTSGAMDGTAGNRRGLQYTDYMRAHTQTRLVDPRTVENRREFKSVKEYEAYRARQAKRPMTEAERAYEAEKEARASAAEEERLRRLKERDERIGLHHNKTAGLFLR